MRIHTLVHRLGIRAVVAVAAAFFLGAQTAVAGPCAFGPNEGAGKLYTGTSVAIGGRTDVDLQIAGAATGWGVAHPFQILPTGSSDWAGWGTYRGVGTNVPGALSNCPDNYGVGWHTYVDGVTFGKYFCRAGYGTLSSSAQDQIFRISRATCSGSVKWAFYLNTTKKTCQALDGSSGRLAAFAEDIGTDEVTHLQINVRYTNLQVKFNAGWAFWNGNTDSCADPGYQVRTISNIDFWAERS